MIILPAYSMAEKDGTAVFLCSAAVLGRMVEVTRALYFFLYIKNA